MCYMCVEIPSVVSGLLSSKRSVGYAHKKNKIFTFRQPCYFVWLFAGIAHATICGFEETTRAIKIKFLPKPYSFQTALIKPISERNLF